MHKINRSLGIVYDSIYHSVIFFNQETVRSFLKLNTEDMSQVFDNYYEFVNDKNVPEPSDDLYPFFYFDAKTPCVIRKYLDKYFDFFNGSIQSFVKLLKEKERLKRFVYNYYLKP